jgi:lipoteichoic acid synthase
MPGNHNLKVREASRALLSPRDWVYLLSLLVPFVIYDLVLKSSLVALQPLGSSFAESLGMISSDVLFNLGYTLLWVGLFAAARRGLLRWVIVGLFHVTTIFIVLVTTSAYQYFKVTGSMLDSGLILFWLSSPGGTGGAIASEFTPGLLTLILAILAYAALGPLLVTHLVAWWRGWTNIYARTPKISWLRLAGVGFTVYALFSFWLVPSAGPASASKFFSKDIFANVVMTATKGIEGEEPAGLTVENTPPPDTGLLPTTETERRNVVLIFLESTRAQSVTPYNKDLETTPFLDELAKSSLMAERAYTVVPHTHNAITAANCGIDPPLDRGGVRMLSIRKPHTCLADLLGEQGYNTVYFMSQRADFENSQRILENLGYKEFYSVETMDQEGFEQSNYFAYEDDIMLEPSKRWLQENRNKPLLVTYLTGAPHHDYKAPEKRYGRVQFTEDDLVNRYLNSIRNQDFFLKKLFDQYKELGLYEDTVFIVMGDHGEGFGEHDRYQHDNVPYEESLRIPLLVHDPRWCGSNGCENGWRIKTPVNHLDILPTIGDLLGYRLQGEEYGGSSLLGPLYGDRTLMFSCLADNYCLASLQGTKKYIYHLDNQSEEFFDLSKDPSERENLAEERSPEELEERRSELLEWRAKLNSKYGSTPPAE